MMGINQILGQLLEKFLERKSKTPMVSLLKSVACLALFGLGLFIAYLRFMRTW
jgi:hypothetical protein